jgi:hypothetical protein
VERGFGVYLMKRFFGWARADMAEDYLKLFGARASS